MAAATPNQPYISVILAISSLLATMSNPPYLQSAAHLVDALLLAVGPHEAGAQHSGIVVGQKVAGGHLRGRGHSVHCLSTHGAQRERVLRAASGTTRCKGLSHCAVPARGSCTG